MFSVFKSVSVHGSTYVLAVSVSDLNVLVNGSAQCDVCSFGTH